MKKAREYFFGRGEDFANALGDGGENGDAFVRVAPYGDAPQFDKSGHEVVQRFDFPAARKLVAEFNARKAKLLSRLGFANYEVPFYNGHPDFAENGGEARDSQVYASAYDLEARVDGLYARIRRHPLLASLKNALGALQISPRWLCEVDIDGILKPFELISFGLVKKGNLPNADFINNNQKIHTKEKEMNEEQLKQARALLSLAEDASVDEVLAAIASLANRQGVAEKANEEAQEALKEKEKELADAANQLADMQGICKRKDDEIVEAKKELDTANETLSEREKELARMILDEAIAAGKMTPAMRKAFEAAFALEFANTAETVKNLPAVADLGDGKKEDEEIKKAEDVSNTERGAARKGFADLVNAMQKDNPNMAFSECVSAVFATADGKKLYEKGF